MSGAGGRLIVSFVEGITCSCNVRNLEQNQAHAAAFRPGFDLIPKTSRDQIKEGTDVALMRTLLRRSMFMAGHAAGTRARMSDVYVFWIYWCLRPISTATNSPPPPIKISIIVIKTAENCKNRQDLPVFSSGRKALQFSHRHLGTHYVAIRFHEPNINVSKMDA